MSLRYQDHMAESQDKGSLLEDIVTRVHVVNGLTARPRVMFPSLRDPGREREIDVLIEASIGPYPIRIPVECKNWGTKVGIDLIDAFQGKLADIGLNVGGAIYVSANGYESGAVDRAKEVGIVLLDVDGLTSDRLSQQLFSAATGTLFVFPSVAQMSFESTHKTGQAGLFSPTGDYGGTLLDFIWKAWIELDSLELVEFQGSEPVPSGWGSYVEGDFASIQKIDFTIRKEGHLLLRKGTATKVVLSKHGEDDAILGHIASSYESPFGKFDLVRVTTEDELKEELGRDNPLVTSLFRVKVL